MAKTNYNWWTDPKNADEVKRASWWNHPENKQTTPFPISAIQDESGGWTVGGNEDTEALIGNLRNAASGETKEEAIKRFFEIIRIAHEWEMEERLSYQRWVPFRRGPWGKTGGNWVSIFGIHIYFRYEKRVKMQGGWYIPFTKLNVSISSDWASYRRWKLERARGAV